MYILQLYIDVYTAIIYNNNNKFILSPKIPGSSVDSHTQNTQ